MVKPTPKPKKDARLEKAKDQEALEQAPLLARLSLTRPIFITSIVLATLFLGYMSFNKLGVDLFPEVQIPIVTVVVPYRGAGPSEIETLVVRPLEEDLSTLGGIKRVFSESNDGVGVVTCQFNSDTDMKNAEQQVRNRVQNLKGRLPREIDEPNILRVSLSDQPIYTVGLEGDLPPAELYDIAKEEIKIRFEQVPGVGKVDLVGGTKREIQVLLDRGVLKEKGVSAGLVATRISENSSNVPVGKVTKDGKDLNFRTLGEYRSLQQIEDAVVSFYDRPVRVRDIGQVIDGVEEAKTLAYVNGRSAIIFKVYKQTGTNTVQVADGVEKALGKINKSLEGRPGAPKVSALQDASLWIRQNVDDVKETIAIGILLVIVVVYFFLGNFRSTFITGLALPNSLLGAFVLMNLAGFTINMMTLLALSLSVGLLIDDAIVVRENIFRHIERGMKPWRAALLGTKEVNMAVIATSSVVIAVFLPVGFLSGTVGSFLAQFGLTMCFAMLISTFDALTIAPMMSAYFAGKEEHAAGKTARFSLGGALVGAVATAIVGYVLGHGKGALYGALVGGLLGALAPGFVEPFNRVQARMEKLYARILQWILTVDYGSQVWRWVYWSKAALLVGGLPLALLAGAVYSGIQTSYVMAGVLAALGVVLGAFTLLIARWLLSQMLRARFLVLEAAALVFIGGLLTAYHGVTGTFIPATDSTEFGVWAELPEGTALATTAVFAAKLDERLRENKDIAVTSLTVEGNKANWYVGLHPGKMRTHTSQQLKAMFRESLNAEFPEGKPTVGDIDVGGNNEKPFTLVLKGDDLSVTSAYANELIVELKKSVPGVVDLDSSYRSGKPEFQVKLDPARAGRLGVSTVTAGMELRALTDGVVAGKYREGGKEYDIRARLKESQRDLEEGYRNAWVPNLNFNLVRLESVATAKRSDGPSRINRRDRSRSVVITGNLGPGAGLSEVLSGSREVLAKVAQPKGVTWDFVGQAEDFEDMGRSMGLAILLAMVIMYLVLASLYESFITPFTIMLALPLAVAGAFYALGLVEFLSKVGFFSTLRDMHLFHVSQLDASINLFSMIGLIMLLGLVAKNSILLVDLTLQHIRDGMTREASVAAAGVARLRPILMTSLALFFGTLPLALAINEAGRFRSSMGIGIAGGLVSSTLLTLVVIPAAFEYIDDFRKVVEGWVKKLGAGEK